MPSTTLPWRQAPDRTARWICVVAGTLTAVWVVAAVMMSGRGLDVTDESFYLLSYRWWNEDVRAFSGVQYLYGPVFDLLGHSVQGLRLFRLSTIVLSHAAFGWSYMTWLRTRRSNAQPSWSWELAGTLTILAAGGITYGWLPLSPGYNDVAMLGTMLVAAVALRSLRAVHLGRALPLLPAAALGPLVVAVLLAKWSTAAAALLLIGGSAAAGFRAAGARGWLRYAAVSLGSFLVTVAFVNYAVMSFRTMLPPLLEVNRLVAAESNSPTYLLHYYYSEALVLLREALPITALAVIIGAAGHAVQRRGRRVWGIAVIIMAVPVTLVATFPESGGLPPTGVAHLPTYAATLFALALSVAATQLARILVRTRARTSRGADGRGAASTGQDVSALRRGARPEHMVVVMLLLLPPTQALGSGNPLQYLAVNQFACWVALLVGTVTALPPASSLRWFAASATACAVIVTVSNGVGGLLFHPYRTAPYADSTSRIGGRGTGASLRVSPQVARYFEDLRTVVGTEGLQGRPMMAFDGGPGFVLVLGGRSVGEGWYSGGLDRTAAGIRWACADGNPWPSDGQPVVMYERRLSPVVRAAIRSCGIGLRSDYREVGRVDGVFGPRKVYLPETPVG